MNKLPRILSAVLAVILLTALFALPAFAEDVVFTGQPQGGEADNWQEFTITWETNVECRCMLQSREDDTYDWGNIDYVESPYSMENCDYTAQYRLWAEIDDADYYSDVFTVTWRPADDVTTIEIGDLDFGELPLGYEEQPAVPLVIKNTGSHPLREYRAFLSDETSLELIENQSPATLAPGETDSTSYSVRPKNGMGILQYRDSVFIEAGNLAGWVYNSCVFEVVESGIELTYVIEADDIDLGSIDEDPEYPVTKDLVIRSAGTGNLTNIHVKLDGADTFFTLHSNNASVDLLPAGAEISNNWYITLNSGLSRGDYSAEIKVYAAEAEEPAVVKITASVNKPADPDSSEPAGSDPQGQNQPTDPSQSAGDPAASAAPSASDSEAPKTEPTLIIVIAIAVLVVIAAVIAVVLKRAKK